MVFFKEVSLKAENTDIFSSNNTISTVSTAL